MDAMSIVRSPNYPGTTVRRHLESTESCSVCQMIADAFLPENVFPPSGLSLGTWEGFLERKECVCCQLIVTCLEKCKPYRIKFEPSCPLELTDMSDCFNIWSDTKLDLHSDGKTWEDDHPDIKLIPKHIVGQKHTGYIPVDPAQIDIARLRIWPEYCGRNHQGACHDLPQWQIIPPASSLILIDVYDYYLVHISNRMNHRYVALSYVWGQISGTIELKKKNFRQLRLKNSLKLPSHLLCIPRTILDAITLTGAMGLRYLWVDRLCIIQDEPTHLTEQLQQMASIYANSYFTIIAADGYDANYGLRGVDSHSSPRSYEEMSFEFTTNFKMIQKPEPESREAFWHTRAWTFQERAVSPRNLVFTHNTVYWQCRTAIWYENIRAELDGITSSDFPESMELSLIDHPSYALKVKPWPDIGQYFTLVNGYNNRDLSFESDALRAFSAVTTAMSKSFPGGFHLGLPVFLFDVGILWSRSASSKRRSSFPSWSWLGWTGHVHIPFGYRHAWKPVFENCEAEVEIKPLVDWYAIHRDGVSRHLIDNSYHLHKADVLDPDFSLPEGWTMTWNEQHDAEAVEYESLPNYSFKYPFPVFPVVTENKVPFFSSYLEFEANSCTLFLGASYDGGTFMSEARMHVDLQDSRGYWVGVIESWYMRGSEYKCGTPCKLVAISEGSAKRNHRNKYGPDYPSIQPFHEMNRDPVFEKLEEYSFYNVLWIEWIGGIAYRQAAGRVLKEAWDRQSITSVSVILG